MNHHSVWHESSMCVTWLITVCDLTHQCVWHDSLMFVTRLINVCGRSFAVCGAGIFRLVSCMTWMCVAWLITAGDMTHHIVRHDSSQFVTWLTNVCGTSLTVCCASISRRSSRIRGTRPPQNSSWNGWTCRWRCEKCHGYLSVSLSPYFSCAHSLPLPWSSLSISLYISISLVLSLSRSLTHTHTNSVSLTLALSFSLNRARVRALSLSLSLPHVCVRSRLSCASHHKSQVIFAKKIKIFWY